MNINARIDITDLVSRIVVIALRPYDEFLSRLQAEGRVTAAEMQALGEASSAELEQLSDALLEGPTIKI
jgi:hypothetical protein